jgi:hypothetical protein
VTWAGAVEVSISPEDVAGQAAEFLRLLADQEAGAWASLERNGFDLAGLRASAKSDNECLSAIEGWLGEQAEWRMADHLAFQVLSQSRNLRLALAAQSPTPDTLTLKLIAVASFAVAYGGFRASFLEAGRGVFADAAQWQVRRSTHREGARKANAKRSSWHGFAFSLMAARLAIQPTVQSKVLYGWTADQINRGRRQMGVREVSDSAVAKAVRDKRALFEEYCDQARRARPIPLQWSQSLEDEPPGQQRERKIQQR